MTSSSSSLSLKRALQIKQDARLVLPGPRGLIQGIGDCQRAADEMTGQQIQPQAPAAQGVRGGLVAERVIAMAAAGIEEDESIADDEAVGRPLRRLELNTAFVGAITQDFRLEIAAHAIRAGKRGLLVDNQRLERFLQHAS